MIVTAGLAMIPQSLKEQKLLNNGFIKNTSLYYVAFFMIFLIYVVVAGIRYNVGTDYITYSMYQIPIALSNMKIVSSYNVEFLYKMVIKLGYFIGGVQWVFVITAMLFVGFVILYIMQRSNNYVLSFLIFVLITFYNFSLNGMRQSIAIGIFLFATKYVVIKKPFKYFFWIIVAVLFHKSAIIYFFLYFLLHFNFVKNKWFLYFLTFISFFIVIFEKKIYTLMLSITLKFNFYSKFFGSIYDGSNQYFHMNIFMLFFNVLMLLFSYYFINTSINDHDYIPVKTEKSLNIDLSIQIIGTIFSLAAFVIPGSFRVYYMFIPIQISLIPNVLSIISNKKVKLIVEVIVILMYFCMFYLLILHWNQNQTLPYKTIFNF